MLDAATDLEIEYNHRDEGLSKTDLISRAAQAEGLLCLLTDTIRRFDKSKEGLMYLRGLLAHRRAMLYFTQPSTRTFLSFSMSRVFFLHGWWCFTLRCAKSLLLLAEKSPNWKGWPLPAIGGASRAGGGRKGGIP